MNILKQARHTFGFDMETRDTQEVLHVHLSFFRFCCLPYGLTFYTFSSAVCLVILASIGFATVSEFFLTCETIDKESTMNNGTSQEAIDFACGFLFTEGTFLCGVLTTTFFFLNVLTSVTYRRREFNTAESVPGIVYVQWMLYTVLLPCTLVSAAAFDMWLKPTRGTIPAYYGFTVTSALFMVMWAMFGIYEMNLRHVLFSNFILSAYIAVIGLLNLAGIKVYPMLDRRDNVGAEVFGLAVFGVVIHLVFIALQKYKIHVRFNSLWRPKSTIGLNETAPNVSGGAP